VNLTAYFSNGWLALAPSAFSYGPSISQVLPNAGAKSGGNTIYIYGYGFGSDTGKVTVTIGGQAATVNKLDALPVSSAGISLDSAYPFPLERIAVSAPAGSPGPADVTVTAPSGSTTLPRSFQFLASLANLPQLRIVQIRALRLFAPTSLFDRHRSCRRFRCAESRVPSRNSAAS
jgi:hypothetical protein